MPPNRTALAAWENATAARFEQSPFPNIVTRQPGIFRIPPNRTALWMVEDVNPKSNITTSFIGR